MALFPGCAEVPPDSCVSSESSCEGDCLSGKVTRIHFSGLVIASPQGCVHSRCCARPPKRECASCRLATPAMVKSCQSRRARGYWVSTNPMGYAVPCPAIVRRFPLAHSGQLATQALVSVHTPNQKYNRDFAANVFSNPRWPPIARHDWWSKHACAAALSPPFAGAAAQTGSDPQRT